MSSKAAYGVAMLVVFVAFMLMLLEIKNFASHETNRGMKITFAVSKVSLRMKFDKLLVYDSNYNYMHVPYRLNLASWCSRVIEEVRRCDTRFKALSVLEVLYFRRGHNVDVPLKLTILHKKACDALLVVPETDNMDVHMVEAKPFRNAGCIVLHPQATLSIGGSGFFVVLIQDAKAWEF